MRCLFALSAVALSRAVQHDDARVASESVSESLAHHQRSLASVGLSVEDFTGVVVLQENSGLMLGQESDVSLLRSGQEELTVLANTTTLSGDLDVRGSSLLINEGTTDVGASLDELFSSLGGSFAAWSVVYQVDLPDNANFDTEEDVPYAVNKADEISDSTFSKIAYYYQLDDEWVFVSMDAFTESASEIGIPVDWDHNGDYVSNLAVYSNSPNLQEYNGQTGLSGTIEHWSNCYGKGDDSIYDNDDVVSSEDCYGSLQVHASNGDTIFSYNAWSSGGVDDFGMGNSAGTHPDWTFAKNGPDIAFKRLSVLVLKNQTDLSGAEQALETQAIENQLDTLQQSFDFPEGWQTVYSLDIVANANYDTMADVPYIVDNADSIPSGSFNRVGYHFQLDDKFVFAQMDAYTPNATLLGIPVDWDHTGDYITNLAVYSNEVRLADYDGLTGMNGTIEHWSNCYGKGTDGLYNSDDQISTSEDCYGSLQVHAGNGDTIFAYNAWSSNGADDVGMGNNPSTASNQHPDWTFARNAGNYAKARLTILVYMAEPNAVAATFPKDSDYGASSAGGAVQSQLWNVDIQKHVNTLYDLSVPKWKLVYQLPIEDNANYDTYADVPYAVDLHDSINNGTFSRVAYHLQLDDEYVYAEMDAFVDHAGFLGVPVDWDHNGDYVYNIFIRSNSPKLGSYDGVSGLSGSIEHWSNCYGKGDDSIYDNDDVISSDDCYGSFQLHSSNGDTIFAFNAWSNNGADDLGIGNYDGSNTDWTFARNAATYTIKQLSVFVLQTGQDEVPVMIHNAVAAGIAAN